MSKGPARRAASRAPIFKLSDIPKPVLIIGIVIAGLIYQLIFTTVVLGLTAGSSGSPSPAPASVSAPASPTPSPTPTPEPSAPKGSVLYAAQRLQIAEPKPSGYDRDEFGQVWADVDRNGCDQRNDALRRDTTERHTKAGTNGCVLQSGVIKNDHYSYAALQVKYERGSSTVEIDHVVSLADAWRMGAYDWSANKREKFANDLMNLEAVDADTNEEKGDESAAEWLPEAEPTDICWFVSRQVTIKTRYRLSVTQAEKDELIASLNSGLCDGSRMKPPSPSMFEAPEPKPLGEPKPKPNPKPKPKPSPKPEPTPERSAEPDEPSEPSVRSGVRPGAFCSPARALGETNRGIAMICKGPGQPRWRAR
jgi:hypothetical protein